MKIAIVGSAPTSIHLAPVADPAWQIWGCSPASVGLLTRVDRWFELHAFEPGTAAFKRDYSPEYLVFLAALKCPVEMISTHLQVPKSRAYPKMEMLAEFGSYFFTSTVSWMLAQAIMERPDEIGLWGVDMAASTEYAQQRPACHHFIDLAQRKGIIVTVPPESDLLEPPPLYGFCEMLPQWKRLQARKAELQDAFDHFESQRAQNVFESNKRAVAIAEINYMLNTYGGRG